MQDVAQVLSQIASQAERSVSTSCDARADQVAVTLCVREYPRRCAVIPCSCCVVLLTSVVSSLYDERPRLLMVQAWRHVLSMRNAKTCLSTDIHPSIQSLHFFRRSDDLGQAKQVIRLEIDRVASSRSGLEQCGAYSSGPVILSTLGGRDMGRIRRACATVNRACWVFTGVIPLVLVSSLMLW